MKTFKIEMCLSLLLAMFFLSGCATSRVSERDKNAARIALELNNIQSDLERIKDQIDGMEKSQQYIDRRLSQLENAQTSDAKDMKEELSKLRRQVAALEGSRGKFKQDIIAHISVKISELMRKQSAASGDVGDTGYEHIVKAGETLSVIAKAYGVRTSVIVKANKIKNPDSLRVGTKLFIPQ